MFLLPVSHEERTVRRVPWISIVILAICVALQVHSCSAMPDIERRGAEIERAMEQLREEVVSERARELAADAAVGRKKAAPRDERGLGGGAPPPLFGELGPGDDDADEWAFRERAHAEFESGQLDDPDDPRMVRHGELTAELEALVMEAPVMRFGYRPALDGLGSLISSMFAHAGWLHLLGNMWFLYLVGCNLEDRWGRWQFISFYLVAGIIAALTFTAFHPEAEIPLVGASGAVAGAMGAFMVCFARTRVKIFYVYWLFLMPRWGTFRASAWMVLLFWIGEQLLWAFIEVSGGGAQVAFSAHVGGFLFGAAVAGALLYLGIDRQLDAQAGLAAERGQEVFSEDPLYIEAMERRDRGDDLAARELLVQLIAQQPRHHGAREALFMVGVSLRDMDALDYSVGYLIGEYGRRQADDALVALYRQLREVMPSYGLTDQELLRIAAACKRIHHAELAITAIRELMEQYPDSDVLPRALWTAAEVQGRYGTPGQQRDTLERLVRRFPQHACGGLARRELEAMGAGV